MKQRILTWAPTEIFVGEASPKNLCKEEKGPQHRKKTIRKKMPHTWIKGHLMRRNPPPPPHRLLISTRGGTSASSCHPHPPASAHESLKRLRLAMIGPKIC